MEATLIGEAGAKGKRGVMAMGVRDGCNKGADAQQYWLARRIDDRNDVVQPSILFTEGSAEPPVSAKSEGNGSATKYELLRTGDGRRTATREAAQALRLMSSQTVTTIGTERRCVAAERSSS